MNLTKWINPKYLPLYFLAAAVLLYPLVEILCIQATHGFSINQIHTNKLRFPIKIQYCKDGKSLSEALNQEYHFLGAGGQCFAFESADHQYVLKLMNNTLYKTPAIFGLAPAKTKVRKQARVMKRTKRDLSSYFLAATKLKEECGLLAIKIGSKSAISKEIKLYDSMNITHKVNVKNCNFILQKKATLLYPYISSLMDNKEVEKAKEAIDSLIALYSLRCKKGIFDEDAKIHRNLGFVNDEPIFIDIGRFVISDLYMETESHFEDLYVATLRFDQWLQEKYPELATYLKAKIKEYGDKLEKEG